MTHLCKHSLYSSLNTLNCCRQNSDISMHKVQHTHDQPPHDCTLSNQRRNETLTYLCVTWNNPMTNIGIPVHTVRRTCSPLATVSQIRRSVQSSHSCGAGNGYCLCAGPQSRRLAALEWRGVQPRTAEYEHKMVILLLSVK